MTGKYISEDNPDDYMELKSNGTFYSEEEGIGFSGSYDVNGNELTLSLAIGFATKVRIEGDVIIDEDRERWVRQSTEGAKVSVPTKVTAPTPEQTSKPARTPMAVVFAAGPRNSRFTNIYTMNNDGTDLVRVADGGMNPLWSPDGQRIAFISNASGDPGTVYIVNRDGTNLTKLTQGETVIRVNRLISWSPNGEWLLSGFQIIRVDGTEVKQRARSSIISIRTWSPDGAKIVYASRGTLYIDHFDGTNITKIDVDGNVRPLAGC